jgi:hypothetical protein
MHIFNMKRIVLGLNIWGTLLIVSAISGISLFWINSQGTIIVHHSNVVLRLLALVCGGGLYYVAWCIRNKRLLGWRLYFVIQAFGWIVFVTLGTNAVSGGYPKESTSDNLLFSIILAIVSVPVAIYWGRRWYKEKKNFIE